MGVMNQGLDAMSALQKYGVLTIGDGLCSQIPSMLISLATGILVTKASKESDIGDILVSQLFGIPKVLYIVGGTMIILGFTPLNFFLFLTFGITFIVAGYSIQKNSEVKAIEEEADRKSVV